MRTPILRTSRVAVSLFLLTLISGAAPATAQFGGLGRVGDAARRAKEEVDARTKKEEEEKKAAEAKKEADTKPAAQPSPAVDAVPVFQTFSKYDFVPGERVVALDDFTQDAVGDFPSRWNTNGSGEVVTIGGQAGRWLKLTRAGFFIPEFVTDLPDNFTLEFDVMVAPTFSSGPTLWAALAQLANPKDPAPWQTSENIFTLHLNPGPAGGSSSTITRQDATSASANSADSPQLSARRNLPVHVSIWRQRQRVRVYLNEEKAWDVPRGLAASARLNSLIFFVPGTIDPNLEYYLANVRLAAGAPDTRNKIITEGRWVSHGILFDVNSDRIKGESFGSLKEIANVLTEAADVRVVIVGHTDSDGDAAANLDLSRRRAASVKAALVNEFKIDAGRLEIDGKGEGEPVDGNDTPAGKANNRRVEFIRK